MILSISNNLTNITLYYTTPYKNVASVEYTSYIFVLHCDI